jgi:hypothetical protein
VIVEDLVRWLSAQLDEDERIARRAGDSFRQIGETGVIVATEGDRAEECASANWGGVAEHIVAHDPARVLREIDSKRQMIETFTRRYEASKASSTSTATGAHWVMLADTLRLLALPYADRSGYEEAVASVLR